MSNGLEIVRAEGVALTVDDVVQRVQMMQDIVSRVMKDGIHFGRVPGCGDRKVMLKPGAEILCVAFRLIPKFIEEFSELQGGHREYRVKCSLMHGTACVGEGVGVCSTLENKYQFRWDSTGEPVPAEYWKTRDSRLIGGVEFAARKVKGSWFIFRRTPHDNPADYYNTVAKMALKRAHVCATITATAASDMFTQDLDEEDVAPDSRPGEDDRTERPQISEPRRASETGGDLKEKFLAALGDLCNGDADAMASKLIEVTTWTDKAGVRHAGKTSIDDMSPKMMSVAYGKLQNEIKARTAAATR